MGIVVTPDGSAVRTSNSTYAGLRESISLVSRAIEDIAWNNLSTDDERGPTHEDRKRTLQRIRLYRRRSPLAKLTANLLQHYALGKGISLRANNRAKIAKIVDEFWEDPANAQVFTSHQAQKESIDGLFTDGDMFLVLFPDIEQGQLHLGLLDALFVEEVIPDRENAKIARWYKAQKPTKKWNFESGSWEVGIGSEFVYYRDWRNEEDKDAPPKSMIADGLIYHVRINKHGRFGESELATAIDWLKAHKDFMEDRASLNKAASQIAWKKKRKGGASEIATEVAKLQSTLVNSQSRWESNPPAASASTIVENEGSSLEWVNTNTGGVAASEDERKLRMMAGAGMGGVPNHYFGDEANANLATATAMELPLLKTYEDWQVLWGDVIRDLIGFLLDTANKAGRIGDRDDSARYSERVTTPRKVLNQPDVADQTGATGAGGMAPASTPAAGVREAAASTQKSDVLLVTQIPKTEPIEDLSAADDSSGKLDWFVDVDFPPIVQKDMVAYSGALKMLYEMAPTGNIESQKMVVEMALNLLGENNIDEVMERLFPADAAPADLVNTPGTVSANDPMALSKAMQALLGAAGANAGTPPAPTAADSAAIVKPVTESLAEYRVRRLVRAAQQANDALLAVGE